MKSYKKLITGLVINLVVFFVLLSALNINVLAADTAPSSLDMGKSIVKENYIGDVSDATIDGAVDMPSLVKSLNDPYSAYFTAEQYADFTGSINNTFSGIGISIDTSTEGIKIVSVFDNTPAKEAGLLVGDIITEVDGHALGGLSTAEATAYVRGVSDTSVHLVVKRGITILSFDVMRKAIVLPTVVGTLLDKHIGYIAISSFGENTATEFKDVYEGLKNSSADSYIVDLRDNGGGYIETARDIAGYFIGNNVLLKIQPKNDKAISYKATDEKEVIDKPVIFLINEYSASASEILSAAVKDYKKAFFIGEKSYGKGVGQSIYPFLDGSYLKLTTFKFVSPLGKEINKVGITPDLEVKDDTTLGIDSLSAARILFSNLNNAVDITNSSKVNFAGKSFNIDLALAKSQDNISTFNYMSTIPSIKEGWNLIDGKWYYGDNSGNKKIGWVKAANKWYYLSSNGEIKTGWVLEGSKWYYLCNTGEMKTGWFLQGTKWYYLVSSGEMKTGWNLVGSSWYYHSSNGQMAASTTINGYKIGSNGAWIK